ncbi:cytidine deaminase [Candidatus Synchoanobacter obligatus]|uniref:Cytidine deaminase n=1 Tax=Candidatus Synchoanobacter obligatus TaxID=2919597 RepID=A0ABT1L609_9GAMM|nr:cytidine deaminase [Candidatus Synchoanobacter obligatus]MCP8352619.1 cytidine deaminase [Candidatus Synchoanobacter obligatus]
MPSKCQGMTKSILEKGKKMLKNSYSPYSEFQVGCVAVTHDGQEFAGCNIENTSYSLTVCAEVSAISNMVSSGHTSIQAIFIFSNSEQFVTPCGACRQTIAEFADHDIPVYLVNQKNEIRKHQLSLLIPHAFDLELQQ